MGVDFVAFRVFPSSLDVPQASETSGKHSVDRLSVPLDVGLTRSSGFFGVLFTDSLYTWSPKSVSLPLWCLGTGLEEILDTIVGHGSSLTLVLCLGQWNEVESEPPCLLVEGLVALAPCSFIKSPVRRRLVSLRSMQGIGSHSPVVCDPLLC